MAYRYDLHCYTNEGSKCSDMSAKEMVRLYHELGYSGICITDHFTNQMNPLADDAPWSERVNLSYDIFQSAYKEGKTLGLSVFWGIEYSLAPDIDRPSQTTGTDFLIFNIKKDWLIENKEVFRTSPKDMFKTLRENGGYIIHAHPMFGDELILFPRYVDAVEVINGGAGDTCNENAKIYAKLYGLAETAGTDIHRYDQRIMAGMETKTPCNTLCELINAIKTGQANPFYITREISEYWEQKQDTASEIRKRRNLS